MQKADYLLRLMKQRTDALVATDEKLQQFLMWLSEKSLSVKVPCKPAAARAFYFALAPVDLDLDRAIARALDLRMIRTDALCLYLDHSLVCTLSCALDDNLAIDNALALSIALNYALDYALESELKQALQQLKEQRSNIDKNEKEFKQWWEANGQVWTEQLRAVMIEHRNIGHNWQFSKQQKELLQQYYYANLLLVDCLNNNSDVIPAVRSHIEDTLLLPIAEIEKHKQLSE